MTILSLRRTLELPERDLRGLRFVGEGLEVSQYQLHEAVFTGRSPVVVSRRVRRWRERTLIKVERTVGFGENRLRLTKSGRDLVVETGAATASDLFVPKASLAPRVLTHTLWINDLRIVLQSEGGFRTVLPAWAIERRFEPRLRAVPDLLAIGKGTVGKTVLAVEVDLGTEPLRSVFLKKLAVLETVLLEMSDGVPAAVLVLTTSEARARSIADAAPFAALSLATDVLPRTPGRRGLEALRQVFRSPMESSSHTTVPEASDPSQVPSAAGRGL